MLRNRSTMRPYSRIASRGATFTVKRFGRTSRVSGPEGGAPSIGATRSCAFTSQTSTRFPAREASSARAAETVLLPTPPFPVTTRRRRSRSSGKALDKLAAGGGEVHHEHRGSREEPDGETRARGGRGADGTARHPAPLQREGDAARADRRVVGADGEVDVRPRRPDRHAGGEPPHHRGR